jgi:signal transduction histidine kinase
LTASYLAVFVVVLGTLSAVAFRFVTREEYDSLEPLLGTAEGQAAYASAARHAALTIVGFDIPLLIVVGVAATVLAAISIGPLRAARAREERFVADAAHELRTPLATIASLAQTAGPDALPRIASVALDASAVVGDLLFLMRGDHVTTAHHEPVDLVTLARKATENIGLRGVVAEIALTAPSGGAYVVGEERDLRRLVDNLLDNAVRYAHSRVDVVIAHTDMQIRLTVEDDGDGVPPELRDRIFERFTKASTHESGTGIGLAICRRITERHGGTIHLDGASRFVVRLRAVTMSS